MNRELEFVVLAYDEALQLLGADAKAAWDRYDARLEDYLEGHPGISRETLDRLVRRYYPRWVNAQKKPSSLPPKA